MVSAMTDSPLDYYDSDPQTGYSVDNLQPVTPSGFQVAFAFEGNELSWNSPTDPDVDHYLIFRSTMPVFPGGEAVAQVSGVTWTDDVNGGNAYDYNYWVVAVDHAGNRSQPTDWEIAQISGVDGGDLPVKVSLFAAFPNPFNPATTIKFDLPTRQFVRLSIYSLDGKLIKTVIDEIRPAGSYEAVWYGRDDQGRAVASGTYVYRMEAGNIRMHRSMTLIK